MKKLQFKPVLLLLVLFSVSFVSLAASNGKPRLERERLGISAPLLDQGDYYVHPSGQKVTFYRKQDVYAIRKKTSSKAKSSIGSMQRFKTQFGERVNAVNGHQLGGVDVIRIDNRAAAKAAAKQAYDIKPQMLLSLDSSMQDLMPIFTTERGQADLLLLPKVTVELNDSIDEVAALAKLKTKYGLRLVRKLKLSADVYSMAFSNESIEPSAQFSQVRRVMNESFVTWAEPQFYVKPVKEQFTLNDTLIGDQWNLVDRGFRGSRCDTDCDAKNAWGLGATPGAGAVTGDGIVIAVIDDGVQLNHPDLNDNIWVNTAELNGTVGVDDDGNGYIDDVKGFDFVNDGDATDICINGEFFSDGEDGQDADPRPRATANCVIPSTSDGPAEDNHGTAVAGILAAEANNGEGIAGVAYNAEIMAIRAISDFNGDPFGSGAFCNTIAEVMEYAAQHADVINNSWSLDAPCLALEGALERVTSGNVAVNTDPMTLSLGSKRNGNNGVGAGSPVIFASGNDARGWVKVTVPVTAGEHAYEWRLLRSDFPGFVETFDDDTVWLDDIVFPDNSTEGFESGIVGFINQWVLNSCNANCTENFGSEPIWDIETNTDFVRSGNQSARISAFVGNNDSDCGNSYLHQIKDGPAGEISFWVWVSTDNQNGEDLFEFLIDGEEVLSYGDVLAFGFVDNAVAYPANLSSTNDGVIAVGASNSGDLSGISSTLLSAEERAPYSQYGPTLDLVAPSSDQHLGITTTDRTGADGDVAGNYTSGFGGTSASAPVVSGVAAAMLAVNPALSAADVKTLLRGSADKIGPVAYVAGRNDFHGFGRVNMFNALRRAINPNVALNNPDPLCSAGTFDYTVDNDLLLSRYEPQAIEFCPAIGPLPEIEVEEEDQFCVPIRTRIGTTAVICL